MRNSMRVTTPKANGKDVVNGELAAVPAVMVATNVSTRSAMLAVYRRAQLCLQNGSVRGSGSLFDGEHIGHIGDLA